MAESIYQLLTNQLMKIGTTLLGSGIDWKCLMEPAGLFKILVNISRTKVVKLNCYPSN